MLRLLCLGGLCLDLVRILNGPRETTAIISPIRTGSMILIRDRLIFVLPIDLEFRVHVAGAVGPDVRQLTSSQILYSEPRHRNYLSSIRAIDRRGRQPSGSSRCHWQLDHHAEPGPRVLGLDPASVEVDGPPGDGEAQADASAGPAPVALDAEEGLEDRSQGVVRGPRCRGRGR